ncbi:MAG: hypothetical protein AB9880_11340 [Christensenellales bacterium]
MKRALSSLLLVTLILLPIAPALSSPEADEGISLRFEYLTQYVPAIGALYGSALGSFVDVTLSNEGKDSATLLAESWIEGLTGRAADTASLAPGESLTFRQSPPLIPEATDALTGEQAGVLRVLVTRTDGAAPLVLHDEEVGVSVYARRDFVWLDGLDAEDNYSLLAAWVSPEAPAIAALLQRAADYTSTLTLQRGYDGTREDAKRTVWQRLEALWGAASEYAVTTETLGEGLDFRGVLHLRTPYDVLAEGRGNYLEKAFLFASATEALGLETALLLTPDHAYIGVRMDQENTLYYFIDPSLIGYQALDQGSLQGEQAWPELKAHLDAGDSGYAWVDLMAVRALGVLPLPFSQERAGSTDTLARKTPSPISIHYIYNEGLITALYHLYGSVLDDFVRIHLTNNSAETYTLLVETGIEGYSTTAASTILVAPGEKVTVRQNPRLNIQAVDALNSRRPGSLFIRITQLRQGEDEVLLNDTVEVTIYSRRDFIWVNGFTPQEVFELYGAWVTPNDPAVEDLIRKAAEYTQSGILISGYNDVADDEQGTVWDRLQAIWLAEEAADLTYISTMVAFSAGYNQRIRTPYDVLAQKSGNCIETTLLFASAAEALELETAIIQIPGHAYLGVRMDKENANYYFIETTLIGRATFQEAVQAGLENWQETQPHLQAGDAEYYWIDLQDARARGILPMPWR